MKVNKVAAAGAVFLVCGLIVACSNVLTYIQHDEGRNITCDGQKGLKRDSPCELTTVPVK